MRNIEKSNIYGIFEEINSLLKKYNKKIEFTIVGGTAFILNDWIDRVTSDIDLINKGNEEIIGMLSQKLDIDINQKTTVASFQYIFKGWENYKKETVTYTNLTVFLLEDEFLIATKFFTRRNDRDLTKASYNNLRLDKDKLEKIVSEKMKEYRILVPMVDNREFEIQEFYNGMGWNFAESIIKKLLQ